MNLRVHLVEGLWRCCINERVQRSRLLRKFLLPEFNSKMYEVNEDDKGHIKSRGETRIYKHTVDYLDSPDNLARKRSRILTRHNVEL